ncbi:MAG: tagaturonate reductase [Gemmatimonadota bacterium]|nr:tagaturonate reductase [Gemmatimonadota bacterium]
MTVRLNRALLDTVRQERGEVVDVPKDALLELPERAVQFGTGALLRGFVDDFVHNANAQGAFGGRIVAIASTGSARDRALREQDGLYTLVVEGIERGQPMRECRIISSVSRAISAADAWNEVLELARQPLLEFVFSNTTEVGIVADEDSGAEDAPPKSFPAKLTRFLYERANAFEYAADRGVTVIPCELIENNGARLNEIVVAIAKRWDLGTTFHEWLDTAVPFCNTLVDRIVPGAPRGADVERMNTMLGYEDALLTTCEPYRLFAIEGDDALRAKLTWATDPGIIIAPDIAPYRKRKVHLLNGAHTLLVPVGLQMGCETVRDAMSQPSIGRFVRRAMLEEIAPYLDAAGAEEFAEAVMDRFRNPHIRHALIDITLQATMKTRVRVVPSIQRYVEQAGSVPQSLAFGFAAFLNLLQGSLQASRRASGLSVPADDQAAPLHTLWQSFPDGASAPVEELVIAACRNRELWGADLTELRGFPESVADHLARMREQGMAAALEHHLGAIQPLL